MRLASFCLVVLAMACGDDAEPNEVDAGSPPRDASSGPEDAGPPRHGAFLALTYNVAGLPEGLSQSMPLTYTPMISPLLNGYDLVLVQESWLTPDDNPLEPLRVYHELLVVDAKHPYKSEPAMHPLNMDPERPEALIGDGLNRLSDFPFDEVMRVRWGRCVDSDADCLALKGFSVARTHLSDGVDVDVYNLHLEAGGTPEDDEAREADLEQLWAFMEDFSEGEAVIVGGDWNLHTDREPAMSQFDSFLEQSELRDACDELDCDHPGNIDKFVFRSSESIELSATSWMLESDVFQTADGEPLSDHDPLAVRFEWTLRD